MTLWRLRRDLLHFGCYPSWVVGLYQRPEGLSQDRLRNAHLFLSCRTTDHHKGEDAFLKALSKLEEEKPSWSFLFVN